MIKVLLKYSYYIISILFLIGLVLVVVVNNLLNNEFYVAIINYYFWYSFGLFSGAFLARIINENYKKLIKSEKIKKQANN